MQGPGNVLRVSGFSRDPQALFAEGERCLKLAQVGREVRRGRQAFDTLGSE